MITGNTEYVDPYIKLVEKYNHLFTKGELEPFAMFGFECGDGWYPLLEQLISHIDHYFKHKYKGVPEGFAIVQVKEKFGGLRFYVHGGDDVVHELIRFAENLADQTCEFCGSNQNIMRSQGWIITACEKCTETRESLKGRKWVKAS
jgi:hypothetical protein